MYSSFFRFYSLYYLEWKLQFCNRGSKHVTKTSSVKYCSKGFLLFIEYITDISRLGHTPSLIIFLKASKCISYTNCPAQCYLVDIYSLVYSTALVMNEQLKLFPPLVLVLNYILKTQKMSNLFSGLFRNKKDRQ